MLRVKLIKANELIYSGGLGGGNRIHLTTNGQINPSTIEQAGWAAASSFTELPSFTGKMSACLHNKLSRVDEQWSCT